MCSVRHQADALRAVLRRPGRRRDGVLGVGADAAACGPRRPSPSDGRVIAAEAEAPTVGDRPRRTPGRWSRRVRSSSRPRGTTRPFAAWSAVSASSAWRSVAAGGDAAGAHAAGHDGGVAGHAAAGGEDALRRCAMPSMSSGEVSRRTRTTFLPVLAASGRLAVSAVKHHHGRRRRRGRRAGAVARILGLLQRAGVELRHAGGRPAGSAPPCSTACVGR